MHNVHLIVQLVLIKYAISMTYINQYLQPISLQYLYLKSRLTPFGSICFMMIIQVHYNYSYVCLHDHA